MVCQSEQDVTADNVVLHCHNKYTKNCTGWRCTCSTLNNSLRCTTCGSGKPIQQQQQSKNSGNDGRGSHGKGGGGGGRGGGRGGDVGGRGGGRGGDVGGRSSSRGAGGGDDNASSSGGNNIGSVDLSEDDTPPVEDVILMYYCNEADDHASRKETYLYQGNIDRARLSDNTEKFGDGWLNSSLICIFIDYFMTKTKTTTTYHFDGDFYSELMKVTRSNEDLPYHNVFRWTKDVDIFEHAQVIFSLSTGTHWYLTCFINVTQCFLSNEEKQKNLHEERPYILVLNSSKGLEIRSSDAIGQLKSYLVEEWIAKKENVPNTDTRRSDERYCEDINLTCNRCKSSFIYSATEQGIGLSKPNHCKECTDRRKRELLEKLHQIPILRPETPQQKNLFDCGVYCVKNTEQVIAKFPKIDKDGSLNVNLNDYTQGDVDKKRQSMKELLTQLIQTYREKKAVRSIDLTNA